MRRFCEGNDFLKCQVSVLWLLFSTSVQYCLCQKEGPQKTKDQTWLLGQRERESLQEKHRTAPEVPLPRNYSGHLGNEPRPIVLAFVPLFDCSISETLKHPPLVFMQVTWSALSPSVSFLMSLQRSFLVFKMSPRTALIPKALCELKWANMSKVLNTLHSTGQAFNQRRLKLPKYASWEVPTMTISTTLSPSGTDPTQSSGNPHPLTLAETSWPGKAVERAALLTEKQAVCMSYRKLKSVHTHMHTCTHTHMFLKSSFNQPTMEPEIS